MSRQLFVNLPVADLGKAVGFFTDLGFAFDAGFTDDSSTCMIVGKDAFVMLLEHDRFSGFTAKPTADARTHTGAILAVSVDSREAVDELADRALANGAQPATDPNDHGFMYGRSFQDLDGHHWEIFWMDADAVEG